MLKKANKIVLNICAAVLIFTVGVVIGHEKSPPVEFVHYTEPMPEKDQSGQEKTRININTASKEELMELPNIGEVTAQKIIEYREQNGPFTSTSDIMSVKGIGEATYLLLMDLICY